MGSNLRAMEIHVKVLHPDAVVPTYAHEGDAGCDLVAVESRSLQAAGGRAMVPTGIAIAIPLGHAGLVVPRSGLAATHGVTCINAPGLIDSGYRGEVTVALVNLDPHTDYEVRKGDRIAQLVVVASSSVEFHVVDDLAPATRGSSGFGSTGR